MPVAEVALLVVDPEQYREITREQRIAVLDGKRRALEDRTRQLCEFDNHRIHDREDQPCGMIDKRADE